MSPTLLAIDAPSWKGLDLLPLRFQPRLKSLRPAVAMDDARVIEHIPSDVAPRCSKTCSAVNVPAKWSLTQQSLRRWIGYWTETPVSAGESSNNPFTAFLAAIRVIAYTCL